MIVASAQPSRKRAVRGALVFLAFGVVASLIRLSRPDFGLLPILAPLDFWGHSPNFMVCAGCPFLAFLSRKEITLPDYVKTALGAAVGISLYEAAQILIPRRTVDLGDVAASFAGAALSVALAAVLFLRKRA